MGIKMRRGHKSADSEKTVSFTPTPVAFVGVSTSDTPATRTNGNASGFSPGDRVIVQGMGKHKLGTIMPGAVPTLGETYVRYRCDFNKGEHLVKAASVQKLGRG